MPVTLKWLNINNCRTHKWLLLFLHGFLEVFQPMVLLVTFCFIFLLDLSQLIKMIYPFSWCKSVWILHQLFKHKWCDVCRVASGSCLYSGNSLLALWTSGLTSFELNKFSVWNEAGLFVWNKLQVCSSLKVYLRQI